MNGIFTRKKCGYIHGFVLEYPFYVDYYTFFHTNMHL